MNLSVGAVPGQLHQAQSPHKWGAWLDPASLLGDGMTAQPAWISLYQGTAVFGAYSAGPAIFLVNDCIPKNQGAGAGSSQ